MAKHRWIIERDYEELKQELGLGHFEGRGWRGFHHHATLCIALVWVPGGRAEPFFPLSPRRPTGATRPENSAPVPAPRLCAPGPSGIIPTPSLHFVSESPDSCFSNSPAAPSAAPDVYNTVVLMETHDPRLLEEWMTRWSDLMDFEVHEVISSSEAAAKVGASK